jgi:hypothetical protein
VQGDGEAPRPLLSALRSKTVRLFKEQFGRGPAGAGATWSAT